MLVLAEAAKARSAARAAPAVIVVAWDPSRLHPPRTPYTIPRPILHTANACSNYACGSPQGKGTMDDAAKEDFKEQFDKIFKKCQSLAPVWKGD